MPYIKTDININIPKVISLSYNDILTAALQLNTEDLMRLILSIDDSVCDFDFSDKLVTELCKIMEEDERGYISNLKNRILLPKKSEKG